MMMKMSPRSTEKFRSRWRTKLPNAIVRSLTTMHGSFVPLISRPFSRCPSDPKDVADQGDYRGGRDDADDSGHHGRRRRLPHRGGASPALHPAHAAGDGHQDPEHRAAEQPDPEV